MQHGQRLLGLGLGPHEPHRGPPGGLADRLGVEEVFLVALHERAHVLGRDQLDLVAHRDELARHVVRADAGPHHDRAGVKLGEDFDELLAQVDADERHSP